MIDHENPPEQSEYHNLELREGSRLLTQVHLNYNLLASLGITVTNYDPIGGEIINFAILPLHPDYTAYAELPFLELWMRPFHQVENGERKSEIFQKARSIGIDGSLAAELLIAWFEKLGLTKGKKIVPIGYNYALLRPLMIRWLGPATYDYLFDWRYRDVMLAAGTVNDLCYWRSEPFPYPKYDLGSIATRSGASFSGRGTYAIETAQTIAATYRGILGVLR